MSRSVGAVILMVALVAGCGGSGDSDHRAVKVPLRGCEDAAREQRRACFEADLSRTMDRARDVDRGLEQVDERAEAEGGYLAANCHVLMHAAGRDYARRHRVTLASLMQYLPATNDPGCSAGFAHGLITQIAPDIDLSDPRGSATVCDDSKTRFLQLRARLRARLHADL